MTKKYLVRAYLTETVYAYRWASSPDEMVTIAADYARERQGRYNGRPRTYKRITLVTYTTGDSGQETEAETVAYVRDDTDWRHPVLKPVA